MRKMANPRQNELEIYVMIEIPHVILADKFAQIFDGFSIGSMI
jgi:pyruvate,water dikinase